ncbi:jg13471 [Pararge aegeria aegeria]|uniref:Jg13471 protein n=1 Tax=Pararge aegeria aegeria TaxID=348720 RepID=A0A8S4QW42_9NEOP|nr:jg13471 [Pararge aegeria aegeria]
MDENNAQDQRSNDELLMSQTRGQGLRILNARGQGLGSEGRGQDLRIDDGRGQGRVGNDGREIDLPMLRGIGVNLVKPLSLIATTVEVQNIKELVGIYVVEDYVLK